MTVAHGAPGPLTAAEFAALMSPLGPIEAAPAAAPALAVAVSGGADSLALALLAAAWAGARGGGVLALVVDHGLRAESAAEAAATAARLAAHAIPARILRLDGLAHGPGLAARARAARHGALAAACRAEGIPHLLLGHHAADQAETLILRALAGSGPAGLAGMAALVETADLRLLRPLLAVPPARLRATLRAAGLDWIEDPSNADPAATRARLRARRADRAGTGFATDALMEAAARAAAARATAETEAAAHLAAHASLRPEGFALLEPVPMPQAALAALLRAIAGAPHAPVGPALAALAAAPRPATLGGARLLPAGRLAPGWLLVIREESRMAAPVPAIAGTVWDGRFRLTRAGEPGCAIGALGADASRLRAASPLPAAVLRTLPAIRRAGELRAVPHLDPAGPGGEVGNFVLGFRPLRPVAGAPFVPAGAPRTGATRKPLAPGMCDGA